MKNSKTLPRCFPRIDKIIFKKIMYSVLSEPGEMSHIRLRLNKS